MENNNKLVLQSIEQLSDQCREAWNGTRTLNFSEDYKNVKNIVVCGMGGSSLPAHIIQTAFSPRLPFVIVNDYHIPHWADSQTLIILSSYSGNTEETLSCAAEAKNKGCKIAGITTGGKLAEFLQTNNYPSYIFQPTHNPSRQPRIGIGYMLFGQVGILEKLGLVSVENVEQELDDIKNRINTISESTKTFATKLQNKMLLIFAAEHLAGCAHTFANQANETAKTFAAWFSIPEANHHLLEGLKHPLMPATALFLDSASYSDSIKKRFDITKDVVAKNNYQMESYKPNASSKLAEVLDTLLFSSFVTFELAVSYNEDPIAIPLVDYFKEQLAK